MKTSLRMSTLLLAVCILFGGAVYTLALTTPTAISGFTATTPMLAAGSGHTLDLRSDGTVWAWGNNESGQLGDGTLLSRSSPVQVRNLINVIYIDAQGDTSAAVKSDGTVWVFGRFESTSNIVPVHLTGFSGINTVTLGGGNVFALRNDGTLWSFDQINQPPITGTTIPNFFAQELIQPQNYQAPYLADVASIAHTHSTSTVAIKRDGTVWTLPSHGPTEQLAGLYDIKAIASSSTHSLALRNDGTVWVWGFNGSRLLGIDNICECPESNSGWPACSCGNFQIETPVQVPSLSNVIAIAASSSGGEWPTPISLAIKNDGTAWGWGANERGQLGDGTIITRTSPTPTGFSNAALIITSPSGSTLFGSTAMRRNGDVWVWGNGNPTPTRVATTQGYFNLIVNNDTEPTTTTTSQNNTSTTKPTTQPPPTNAADTIFGTGWVATPFNWLLFYVCFGWLWMWFI